MSSRPAFLFVPGAWHTPVYFEPLITKLANDGYDCHAVTTPSVGSHPAVESIEADIDAISLTAKSILELGKNVIVVAHSYGGVCGTAAVARVHKQQQQQQQNHKTMQPGRILRLVYVTSFIPLEGESLITLQTQLPGLPTSSAPFRSFEGPWVCLNDSADEFLYHDVTDPMRSRWRQITDRHAVAVLKTPITEAGWRHVPTTYIYTALDRVLNIEKQRWQVSRAKESGVQTASDIQPFNGELGEFLLDCGHTPFLGDKLEDLRSILVQIAVKA